MKLGLVGLPNVGKSTLFNAITKAGAECANYPFCTIEPNIGSVPVPDERLTVLQKMYNSTKIIPAILEFVDIAGLVKGASKGEGLGNKFLSHIREVDAIVHVVRCFEDANIIHVDGAPSPMRDIETINTELILSDIDTVAKRLDKVRKASKGGDKSATAEIDILRRIADALDKGNTIRSIKWSDKEREDVDKMLLLTSKPVIYCCNIAESDIGKSGNQYVDSVASIAGGDNSEYVVISCKVEEEIVQLPQEERAAFVEELGLGESGLDKIVRLGYKLLGLISYITAGEKEIRAWTIAVGTKAPQAAGRIHSDFEKGFIRAEVAAYSDLVTLGSIAAVREKGKYKSEGKDYVVKDGDVILFRFNV